MLAKQMAGDPEMALAPLREALDRVAIRRQREAGFDAPRPVRLALGIDQAERLFSEAAPEMAAALAALLAAMVRQRLATVVMALRSDAYASFQGSEALVALREYGATLDLVPPNAAELEEIVTRPVAACQPPLAFEVADGRSLAARLVADAQGGDALPLLQVSLARLYTAEAGRGDGVLRFADYSGMDAAVTQTANEALATLDPAARAELPALVAALVSDVSTDPLTGAAAPVVAALDRRSFETSPTRAALVEAFVAKRLLTAEGDGDRPLVRPVHEALLRIWPQAVAIVAETASLIQVRHTLAPQVRAWSEADAAAKPAHLNLSPALLDGAQGLLARFGADLPAEMRAFIGEAAAADAVRRDRDRTEQERRIRDAEALAAARRRTARRTMAGLAAALVLAVLAGWQWHIAGQQRDRAQRSLALAIQTATGLVTNGALKYNTAPGSATVVKVILNHARQLQEELLSAGETNGDLLRSQALALAISADMLRVIGDIRAGLADAIHAQTIMRGLLAGDASEVNLGGLAYADFYVAIANYTIGDLPAARANVQEALTITQRFADALPDAPVWQNLLFTAHRGMGLVLLAQGDLPGSLAQFETVLAMVKRRAAAQPNAAVGQDFAVAYAGIGAVQQEQGDLPAALVSDRLALTAMEANAKADPANMLFQDQLATGEQKAGEVQCLKGDLPDALASEQASLAIRERLSTADPENAALRAEAAQTRYWLGRVLEAQGDLPGALTNYRTSASVSENLAKSNPDETVWHRYFAVASGRAAILEARNGDAGAAQRLRDARTMLADLAQRSPSNAQLPKDIAWIDQQIGLLK
jgi:tetratricopeptide (TPR) repeat protein